VPQQVIFVPHKKLAVVRGENLAKVIFQRNLFLVWVSLERRVSDEKKFRKKSIFFKRDLDKFI